MTLLDHDPGTKEEAIERYQKAVYLWALSKRLGQTKTMGIYSIEALILDSILMDDFGMSPLDTELLHAEAIHCERLRHNEGRDNQS
jgi:hypothetical protein